MDVEPRGKGVVEYAVTRYRLGTFPEEWGVPPSEQNKRNAWIMAHVDTAAKTGRYKQLQRADIRLANIVRQAEIERRRDRWDWYEPQAPMLGRDARRELQRRRVGP